MSKKIEDLMYQSGLTADGCWNEMDAYDRGAIERLIYLIVEECAWAADFADSNPGNFVKQHFGVKQ